MRSRHILPLLLAVCSAVAAQVARQDTQPATKQDGRQDYSVAERLLFMSDQLGALKPPATLHYRFNKLGTLEPGHEDRIVLTLKTGADGRCCATHTRFLSAERELKLPDLPAAQGNPVILHFLEHEVREMQRLTQGSQAHFRKRIRLAVYGGATVQPVALRFRGRSVMGQSVRFSPYLDDPNRPRYERLAHKEVIFFLSNAVPGVLFGIRTQVAAAGTATPLLQEELYAEGAEPPATPSEIK